MLGYAVEIARLAAWLAVLLALFIPLERVFALREAKVVRKEFWTDLGWYSLNGLVTKAALVVPMSLLAWGMNKVMPSALHHWMAGLPIGARLVLAFVVGEIGFYWGHRLSHEIPVLWRFHAIHHSAEHMDWLVNTRAHPVDLVFTRLCGYVPLYALGLAQPQSNTFDLVPILVLLGSTVWGFVIHANVRWRLEWLSWLVSTPSFHHWHHTRSDQRDRNYAAMMPVMDRIFGTFYVPKNRWPTDYGIDAAMPPGIVGQLVQPLRGHAAPTSAAPTSAAPTGAVMADLPSTIVPSRGG